MEEVRLTSEAVRALDAETEAFGELLDDLAEAAARARNPKGPVCIELQDVQTVKQRLKIIHE